MGTFSACCIVKFLSINSLNSGKIPLRCNEVVHDCSWQSSCYIPHDCRFFRCFRCKTILNYNLLHIPKLMQYVGHLQKRAWCDEITAGASILPAISIEPNQTGSQEQLDLNTAGHEANTSTKFTTLSRRSTLPDWLKLGSASLRPERCFHSWGLKRQVTSYTRNYDSSDSKQCTGERLPSNVKLW